MSEGRIPPSVTCESFREHLYAFEADELSQADRRRFQAHLDGCAACARRLEVEASFSRGLRARLAPVEPPPWLESAVRARLAGAAPARRGRVRAWLSSPALAAVAASALLAVLLMPPLLAPAAPSGARGAPAILHGSRDATIVDLVCDQAGLSASAQRRCRAVTHPNALKLADGSYWGILPDGDLARGIIDAQNRRGEKIVVEGEFYPAIHMIRLIRVRQALDTAGAAATPSTILATL